MQTIQIAGRLGRSHGLATRLIRNYASSADKVYELRLYQMKPECYRDSLDMLKQYWPVRTTHSQDVGSWMTELGGICETIHMWEYDGLGDRIARRQNVANDPVWRKEFLPKFFEQSHKLNCLLLKPHKGSEVITTVSPSEKAVYELFNAQAGLYSPKSDNNETVIGHFETVYGKAMGEFVLYRYTDPDMAFERAYKRQKDHKFNSWSRLLVPCEWSRLK
ncbi:hypothetical protein ACOMHN_052315 [Nucella lapillus]